MVSPRFQILSTLDIRTTPAQLMPTKWCTGKEMENKFYLDIRQYISFFTILPRLENDANITKFIIFTESQFGNDRMTETEATIEDDSRKKKTQY